jgi:hypothetical protein
MNFCDYEYLAKGLTHSNKLKLSAMGTYMERGSKHFSVSAIQETE